MPLIMLDGVDGVGKSTLAQHLVAQWAGPARVIHRSRFEGNPMAEYEAPLLDYRPGSGELLVLDRWHLSELIYGRILRGGSKVTQRDVIHVEKVLASRGSLNLAMTAPLGLIQERLRNRGEDYLPADQVFAVNKAFVSWAKEKPKRWILQRGPGQLTPGEILDAAIALERTILLLDAPVSYLGNPDPLHLLVLQDSELPLAGQPTWHEDTQSLQYPVQVRSDRIGQVYEKDLTKDFWHRLGCPPLLAQNAGINQRLYDRGWALVDVY